MANYSPTIPWKGADFIGDALKTFLYSRGSADADLAESRDVLEYRSRALYQNAPLPVLRSIRKLSTLSVRVCLVVLRRSRNS